MKSQKILLDRVKQHRTQTGGLDTIRMANEEGLRVLGVSFADPMVLAKLEFPEDGPRILLNSNVSLGEARHGVLQSLEHYLANPDGHEGFTILREPFADTKDR